MVSRAQIAAYGRRFHEQELTSELEELLRSLLTEAGYTAQSKDGQCPPLPIKLPHNAEAQLRQLLSAIARRQTQLGAALLFSDMQRAIQEIFNLPALSEWQAEQLVALDALEKVLRQTGYQTALQ